MITITQPKSKYGPINDIDGFTLKWASTINGQIAYEILYKLKDSTTWSTSGKINSTSSEYNLINIYNNLGVDFTEIQYKIKLWYSTTNTTGVLTAEEESDVYTLIFSQPISGYLNVYDGSAIQQYPLFSNINGNTNPTLNIQTNNGILSTVLVDSDNPLSSNLKINVNDSNKSIAKDNANLSNGYTQRSTPTEFVQNGINSEYGYYYYTNDVEAYNSYIDSYYYYKSNTSQQYYYYYKDIDSYYTGYYYANTLGYYWYYYGYRYNSHFYYYMYMDGRQWASDVGYYFLNYAFHPDSRSYYYNSSYYFYGPYQGTYSFSGYDNYAGHPYGYGGNTYLYGSAGRTYNAAKYLYRRSSGYKYYDYNAQGTNDGYYSYYYQNDVHGYYQIDSNYSYRYYTYDT